MDDDRPISDAEIDMFYTLARETGIYWQALKKQGLPEHLVDRLVRDWHMLVVQQPIHVGNQLMHPQAIARAVREELLKLGKRNGGQGGLFSDYS